MEKIYLELQSRLEEELGEAEKLENIFLRLEACIKVTRDAFSSLREQVINNPFSCRSEEIHFFKCIKPAFYSKYIYYMNLYRIETRKPIGGKDALRHYFRSELAALQRFFERNRSIYEYHRSGWNYLDEKLYLRGQFEVQLNPDDHGPDPLFSTNYDYKIAKIIAAELLVTYVENYLSSAQTFATERTAQDKSFKWTGDSINLVEFAYGIWLTGQINDGNASISEIVRWLEENLQVNIGRAHRRWTEISQRKRSSHTKYLDRMREAVLERIDSELGLEKRSKW